MANARAIAAVSAVLKDLLTNGFVDAQVGNDATVRLEAPPTGNSNTAQVNLFLYQVTPNLSWRNECLPSQNSRGDRLTNPPLALNLHYLLTAYGSAEYESEVLLGHAMQLLHENTILSRDFVRRSLAGGANASEQALAAAGLAEQIELIKITPEYLDTEAMTRLWSSLQANYRMSTAYQVSVVLIESTESTSVAPPVLNRRVFALPMNAPVIEQVDPQLVTAGGAVVVKGQGLKGQTTQIAFGNAAIAPLPATASDQQINVTLPAGLQAGVNTLQVLHPLNLGTPTEPHQGAASNVVAFVLQPSLVETAPGPPATYDVAFLPDEAAFNAAFTADERSRFTRPVTFPAIRLRLTPVVVGTQRLMLLLNETPAPTDRGARAYSFTEPALLIAPADIPIGGTAAGLSPADQRSDILVFSAAGAIAGDYLLRVRADGADSPLIRAPIANSNDPMAPFVGPLLAIGP